MRAFTTVFTETAEYQFVDNVCRGIRVRRSGRWLQAHPALNRRLAGNANLDESTAERERRMRFEGTSWRNPNPVRFLLTTPRRG